MEQRIRNTAGFYDGAGVTPAPTPVPTTDQATYRVVEWNGASVKVLCDKYGRLFVLKDTTSDNIDGVAWTAEGIDNTFDNIDQHEQAFTEIIHTYGYNDAVRSIGVDNYVIEIGGEEVEFRFQDGQLVPVASQWQQGATPMFFYRTLNDGTNVVTVVCDPHGKLYVIDNDGYLIKGQNGYAWSIGAAPQALVTNAGGKVTMDAYTDEDETTIISMDGYTVVIDLDGLVTVGEILPYDAVITSAKYGASSDSITNDWPMSGTTRTQLIDFYIEVEGVNLTREAVNVLLKNLAGDDVTVETDVVDNKMIFYCDGSSMQLDEARIMVNNQQYGGAISY